MLRFLDGRGIPVALLVALAACEPGNDNTVGEPVGTLPDSTFCVPGTQISCQPACDGVQTCLEDGTQFGQCDCEPDVAAAGNGGAAGAAGAGTAAGNGGVAGMAGVAGGAGMAGMAGDGAVAFCDTYSRMCGFGTTERYADRDTCEARYSNEFTADRRSCVEEHLGLAVEDANPTLHCPHATGFAPCN